MDSLPAHLRQLFFPPAKKAESFEPGKLVKGRNEPCAIGGVAWVMHRLRHEEGVTFQDVIEHSWRNTVALFKLDEKDLAQSD